MGCISARRDKAMFHLMYQHGLRASEVGLLKIADLDLAHRSIFLHRLKDGVSGRRVMFPEVVPLLRAYLRRRKDKNPHLFLSARNRPISRRMIDVLVKRYGEKAGIPPELRHAHALRHSCGFHMVDSGADIRVIQDHLGHSSILSTQRYTEVSQHRREKLIEALRTSPTFVSGRKR